jgi:hypothetical protein
MKSLPHAICTGAVLFLSGCILLSCAPRTDLSPAATVGGEKISRACLDFAHRKNSDAGKSKEETLSALANQVLLARKAVEAGLHGTPGYRRLSDREISAVRLDFLCRELAVSGDCAAGLLSLLVQHTGLSAGAIDWDRVFAPRLEAPVPLGGALPSAKKKQTPAGPVTDWSYADSIVIRSNAGATTLARVLKTAPPGETAALADAGPGERGPLFRMMLIALFTDDLARLLPADRRDLMAEIEKRADEHVLSGMLQEMPLPPTVRVSNDEAKDFFEKNSGIFSEPAWADLSHIRLADFRTARELYGKLVSSPGDFCDLARRHSIAADKTRCGRLGKITRRKGLPLHLEFAFTLSREGEISEPVKAGKHFEILKLNARGLRHLAFNDPHTRRLIAERMRPLLIKKALDEALREMSAKHPVVYYP